MRRVTGGPAKLLAGHKAHWLGFIDTFRTICIDPKEEIRATFEVMRNSWERV